MANSIDDDDYVVCKHCGERFRAITVPHLRSEHGYTGEHPVREYKERFGLDSASSPEVRARIKERKIEFWEGRNQHWTSDKILGEIRRRYQAGESLKSKQVPNGLILAAARRFGSWGVALQMVSLDYDKITSRRHWTREKVIAEIRKLEADQVPLNSSWIMSRYGDLYSAAIKLFPRSWGKALQAAGFDPVEHKRRRGRWNRKLAVAWVQKRIDKGLPVLARDAPSDLQQFVRMILKKPWTDFVESFGIPYPGVKKRRDWSKETLLDEIRRWAAEGHRTNRRTVARDYQALIHQGVKRFGSWDAARAAAGVEIDRGRASKPAPQITVESAVETAAAASRPAEFAAHRATLPHSEDVRSAPIRRQAETGQGSRRGGGEPSRPISSDPILAFLARGGLDEPAASEDRLPSPK